MNREINQYFDGAKIERLPSTNIASFGHTSYIYYHLSPLGPGKTRIREGNFLVKKPVIFSLDQPEKFIEGFDPLALELAENLLEKHKRELWILGYRFQHVPRESWVESKSVKDALIDISTMTEDNPISSIVIGHEQHWEISLLKLCAKIIERSLHINLSEFEERGMFDQNGIPPSVYRDIEKLFHLAQKDPRYVKELGNLLLRYNLFGEYEERFFRFFKPSKK